MYQEYRIEELISKSKSDSDNRHDLLVPSKQLRYFSARDKNLKRVYSLKIEGDGPESGKYYKTTKHTEAQICSKLLIGSKYWKHMKETLPTLLQANVNVGFDNRSSVHTLRTLNGEARAFLSDRYHSVDNYDVILNVFRTLDEMGMKPGTDYKVASSSIYNHKLYLKIVFPRISGEVKKGDIVEAGILVQNCEIGLASCSLRGFVGRLVCTNGLVLPLMEKSPLIRRHVGPKQTIGDYNLGAPYRVIIPEVTMNDGLKETLEKMRSGIRYYADEGNFKEIVDMMTGTTKDQITGNPAAVVQKISHVYSLTETEQDIVLSRLLNHDSQTEGMTRWALINSITEASKQSTNYARATELEAKGGQLLVMKPSVWKKISETPSMLDEIEAEVSSTRKELVLH